MKGLFVTGTDTGSGKTIISGLLARYLSGKGHNVITQKWIATGCRAGFAEDVRLHCKIMHRKAGELKDYFKLICPYTFKTPSSPHLASKIENRPIRPEKIVNTFRALSRDFDFVIAEGIGGALVPYNEKGLVIDVARRLDLPVLLVAANKLGAINHTLLTIEALRRRKIRILGIIFNNQENEDKLIIKDNPVIIEKLSNCRIFGSLPWVKEYDKLYRKFIPAGERIYRTLKVR